MALFPASERFWSASEAWTAARVSAQAKAGAGAGSLARTEARWRLNASSYLRGTPSLAARAWIYPGPEASRDAARQIEGIAPQVQEVMDEVLAAALFEAWRSWPVASGLSKSLLTIVWTADGPELIGTLVSGAPYSTFIKSAKVGDTRLPSEIRPTTLLDKAGKQAQLQVIERLAATKAGAQ